MRAALALVLMIASPAAGPAGAQTQQQPVDPRQLAAQQAFETLPEGERRAIQQDLTFATRFSGAASGNFGSLTFAAIQAFEKDRKLVVDGILAPQERQALAEQAAGERKTLKFALQDDRRTGARIGIPEAILSRRTDAPTGGSRWQSADGRVTLDTQVFPPEESLIQLYEKAITPAATGRKVTYKLLRQDFFVISGETASGKFYRRVSLAADGKMRGFALGYDKSSEAQMARMVIAIANTYEAFPQPGATTAAVPRPLPAAVPSIPAIAPIPAERLATGIVLDATTVLTSALAVKDCRTLLVGQQKATGRILAANTALGLALVKAVGLTPTGLTMGAADASQPHVVLAQIWAGTAATTHYGEAVLSSHGKHVTAPLQPGGTGAAVFDSKGALTGVVSDDPAARRRVAGIVPIARYAMVGAADISRFLEKNAVVPAKPTTGTGLASTAADKRANIVALHCTP